MWTMRLREAVFLVLVGVVCLQAGIVLAAESKYFITASKVIRAGQQYVVSIQVGQISGTALFVGEIYKPYNRPYTGYAEDSISLSSGQSGELMLSIPTFIDNPYSIYLRVNGSGSTDIQFSNKSALTWSTKSVSPFIQTDKAIYKPGQEVKFRAFVMHPDMSTSREAINLTVISPSNNKRAFWPNLIEPAGVASKSFQLSDQPPLGEWKITLNHHMLAKEYEKIFEVAEYTLPKFEVKVKLPSYYHKDMGSLKGKVEAKYTYGQGVDGNVSMQVQLKPRISHYTYTSFNLSGQVENGTFEFDIPQETLRRLEEFYQQVKSKGKEDIEENSEEEGTTRPPKPNIEHLMDQQIDFRATVMETLTGVELAGEGSVKVERSKYKFEFTDSTATDFKPGLNFVAYIQVSQPDGNPPAPEDDYEMVKMQARLEEYDEPEDDWAQPRLNSAETIDYEMNFKDTMSGIATFNIRVPSKYSKMQLTITSTLEDHPNYGSPKNVEEFKSLSRQSMQLSMGGGVTKIKTGDMVTFILESTEEIEYFSYLLLNKGRVVHQAVVLNAQFTNYSTFDIIFSGALATALAPRARMLAYYTRDDKDKELIVDTLDFVSKDVFAHKVSVAFSQEQVEPGDDLQLEATADAGSYLGVLVVDKSVLLLKTGNDIEESVVAAELDQYDPAYEHYMPRRRKRSSPMCWRCYNPYHYIGGKDGQELISNAGFIVFTDSYIHAHVDELHLMPVVMRAELMEEDMDGAGAQAGQAGPQDDGDAAEYNNEESGKTQHSDQQEGTQEIRSEFPESWIFTDAQIGPDGTLSEPIKAPDTITSWVASAFAISDENGLGVAETAELTVFKPFFASLTLPYSLIRGEKFKLLVTIFNYEDQSQDVTVRLKGSDDFVIYTAETMDDENVVPTGQDEVSTVVVPANKGATIFFWIEPYQFLGLMDIEVHASSLMAADALRRTLLVKPEGLPQVKSQPFLAMRDGSSSDPTLHQFQITYPESLVEDSEKVTVTIAGDILGGSIDNIDKLVRMPSGCGEQNMIGYAPNVYVMQYLKRTGQLTAELETRLKTYMSSGYNRELDYQRDDGSFSAFGDSDADGSMWLSAFVMRVFLHNEVTVPDMVDPEKITDVTEWIIENQNKDGSFKEPGRVIHKGMQGGTSSGITLTAYVLTTLAENQEWVKAALDDNEDIGRFESSMTSAQKYLEANLDDIDSSYALAILTYALLKSNSSEAEDTLTRFESFGKSEGGTTFWECGPPECSTGHSYGQANAGQVELNAVALLIYAHQRAIDKGLPLMRWLIKQMNGNGGFSSTQDTVLGLQALAEFGALVANPSMQNMRIKLIDGENEPREIDLNQANNMLFLIHEVDSGVDSIEIEATGTGTALIQLTQKYNIHKDYVESPVKVRASSTKRGDQLDLEVCAWIDDLEQNGMAIINMYHLSGYKLAKKGILEQNPLAKRVDLDEDRLVIYLDELPEEDLAACFNLIADRVAEVENIKPAEVTARLYYAPDLYQSQMYGLELASDIDKPAREISRATTTVTDLISRLPTVTVPEGTPTKAEIVEAATTESKQADVPGHSTVDEIAETSPTESTSTTKKSTTVRGAGTLIRSSPLAIMMGVCTLMLLVTDDPDRKPNSTWTLPQGSGVTSRSSQTITASGSTKNRATSEPAQKHNNWPQTNHSKMLGNYSTLMNRPTTGNYSTLRNTTGNYSTLRNTTHTEEVTKPSTPTRPDWSTDTERISERPVQGGISAASPVLFPLSWALRLICCVYVLVIEGMC